MRSRLIPIGFLLALAGVVLGQQIFGPIGGGGTSSGGGTNYVFDTTQFSVVNTTNVALLSGVPLTNTILRGITLANGINNTGALTNTTSFTNGGAVTIAGGVTNFSAVENRSTLTNAGAVTIAGGLTNFAPVENRSTLSNNFNVYLANSSTLFIGTNISLVYSPVSAGLLANSATLGGSILELNDNGVIQIVNLQTNWAGLNVAGGVTNYSAVANRSTLTNSGAVNIAGGVTNWSSVDTRGAATNAAGLNVLNGITNWSVGITNAGWLNQAGGVTNYGATDNRGAVTNAGMVNTLGGYTNWIGGQFKGTLLLSSNYFVQAGGSSSNAIGGGKLFWSTTLFTNLNTAAALSNLANVTIAGNVLTNNGDVIHAKWGGVYTNTFVNTNQFQIVFGSQTILDTGLQPSSNSVWFGEVWITRTGNTAQHAEAYFDWGFGSGAPFGRTNVNLEIAQTNGINTTLALKGAARIAAAVTNNSFFVWYEPAN